MTLDIQDFVAQDDGVQVEDVPPAVQDRLNQALAELTGGDSPTTGGDDGTLADLIVSKSGSGDYSTISGALSAIRSGDEDAEVVFVESGTYREKVTVDEPVTLQAAGGGERPTVEAPDGTGTTLEVSADGVTIDGFEIRNRLGKNSGFSYNQCVNVGPVSGLTIRNNEFRNVGTDDQARGNSGAVVIQAKNENVASNISIVNNIFERIRGDFNPDTSYPNRVPKAIYISTNPSGKDTSGSSGTVQNLEITDNEINDIAGPVSAHGIQLHYRVQDVNIKNNLIHDIRGDPENNVKDFGFGGGEGSLEYDFASALQFSKGGGGVGGPLKNVRVESNYISADSSPANLSETSDGERDDSATPGFALEVAGFTEPQTVELRNNAIEADGGIINKVSGGSEASTGTTFSGGAVDAVENWWGDASGPSSADQDPNAPYSSAGGGATADGSGALVVDYNEDGTAEVNFDGFLESQPVTEP